MEMPLTNFSASAQASLAAALHEATTRRAAELEPEHLLLGLLTPSAGSAWGVMTGTMGDPRPLRAPAEAALGDLPLAHDGAAPILSHRTERVLREASGEAQRAGGGPIDALHLLLGLLDEGGAAAQILRQHGLDAARLRQWMRQRPPEPPPAPLAEATPIVEPPVVSGPLWQVLPRLIDWRAVAVLALVVAGGGWMALQPRFETAGVVLFVLGGWLVSLCAHEFAHALVADLGGDQSVRARGYLSFNPLAYTHVMLSIVMPLLFLLMGGIGLPGGAVYINEGRLRGPLWRSLVSAAGPIASLLVTLVMALPFVVGMADPLAIRESLAFWGALALLVLLNLTGVLLNSLPLPPLDGFGVLAPWLPVGLRFRLYQMGSLGIWLLFLGLWFFDPLSDAFWGTILSAVRALGVPPELVGYGLNRFMFWR